MFLPSASYEQDTELFNFDYKEDLLTMARERDRVFSLSKFQTQAEHEQESLEAAKEKERKNAFYNRIYGAGEDNKKTYVEDSSEAEYLEPERTSYPVNEGITNNFGKFAKLNNADDMEFD